MPLQTCMCDNQEWVDMEKGNLASFKIPSVWKVVQYIPIKTKNAADWENRKGEAYLKSWQWQGVTYKSTQENNSVLHQLFLLILLLSLSYLLLEEMPIFLQNTSLNWRLAALAAL